MNQSAEGVTASNQWHHHCGEEGPPKNYSHHAPTWRRRRRSRLMKSFPSRLSYTLNTYKYTRLHAHFAQENLLEESFPILPILITSPRFKGEAGHGQKNGARQQKSFHHRSPWWGFLFRLTSSSDPSDPDGYNQAVAQTTSQNKLNVFLIIELIIDLYLGR